MTREFKEFA
jgi:hypothetical protein